MTDQPRAALIEMTVGIVANYVTQNRVDPGALPGLIAATHSALATAGAPPSEPESAPDKPSAAQVRRSVSETGLVSFIDGKIYQSLRRHLTTHGFTPETYRETFGLPTDYPMVGPAYSAKRSTLAKALGLGLGGRKPKSAAFARRGRHPLRLRSGPSERRPVKARCPR